MIFSLIIIKVYLLTLFNAYPYFPKCETYNKNATVLNSLNGKIKGACYNVTVNYGYKPNATNQVLNWLGIPYAEAPIDDLRFKNPEPVKNWKKTKDGTQWGYHCIQWDDNDIDEFSSEDCLFLNIFVPYKTYVDSVIEQKTCKQAPVYIWIHGGSNYAGSATDDTYEASTLVAMSNIIVVTINYRLGPFGFFTITDSDAKGNQGFLDQTLAFKWVYENAVRFGGDPSKITIGGESAGAWDVGFHLLYRKSWPYFRNAILESGNPTDMSSQILRTPEQATESSIKVGEHFGCNTNDHKKLFKCLQSIKTNDFYKIASDDFGRLVDLFMPHIYDGEVFTQQPRHLFETGNFKNCSLLIGTNTHEFLAFVSNDYMNLTDLEQSLLYNPGSLAYNFSKYFTKYNMTKKEDFFNKIINLYITNETNKIASNRNFLMDYVSMITDECYRCPSYLLADYYLKKNLSTYVYSYGHRISSSDLPPVDGAGHGEELTIVFAEALSVKKPPLISWNSHSSTIHNYSISERLFTEQVVTYWTSFIKYGNPNSIVPIWPLFNNIHMEKNVMFLKADNITSLNINITDSKCEFWNL